MKKVISLFLFVVMVFGLTACANNTTPTGTTAASTAAASTEAASTEAASTAAASAAAATSEGTGSSKTYVKYWDAEESLGDIPNPGKALNIGFTAKALENEFWRMEKEGAEAGAKALTDAGLNVKMTVQAAAGESDQEGQTAVLNSMLNAGYDGIMVAPISDSNLTEALTSASTQGIPVTYVNDKDANVDLPIVGADHKDTAEIAAEWIAKKIGGSGTVAVVQGLPTAEAARLRTECFVDYMKKNYPNITIVATQNADWDRTKAQDVASTILTQYPDLNAFYANNDTMAMGVLEAVKAANLLGKCLVVGTDGTSEALNSIKAGELSATVNDFPYYQSQVALEMLVRKIAGQDVPKYIYSPHAIVDSSNSNQSDEEILGWKGFTVAK